MYIINQINHEGEKERKNITLEFTNCRILHALKKEQSLRLSIIFHVTLQVNSDIVLVHTDKACLSHQYQQRKRYL